jgi:hypothetical protein
VKPEDVPEEWVRAAEAHYSMHGHGLLRNILVGVAPVIAAAERERIAAWLRRAAAGRREYASRGPDDHEVKPMLELAASCCESAAQLITDPAHMLDVIPAWRWTEAEIADLHGGNGTG